MSKIVWLTNPKKQLSIGCDLPDKIPSVFPADNPPEGVDKAFPLFLSEILGMDIDEYVFTGKKNEMKEAVNQLTGNRPLLKWSWYKNYFVHFGLKEIVITDYMINFAPNIGTAISMILELVKMERRVICLHEWFDSKNPNQVEVLKGMLPYFRLFNESDSFFRRNAVKDSEGNSINRWSSYTIDQFPGFNEFYDEYIRGKLSKKRFSELLGISRPTLNKFLQERELSSIDFSKAERYLKAVKAGTMSVNEAAEQLKINPKTLKRLFRTNMK